MKRDDTQRPVTHPQGEQTESLRATADRIQARTIAKLNAVSQAWHAREAITKTMNAEQHNPSSTVVCEQDAAHGPATAVHYDSGIYWRCRTCSHQWKALVQLTSDVTTK